MTTAYNLQAWSKTAASNSGADAGIGILADSSYPNTVDNWWRGDMAAVARWKADTGGGLIAGGTENALTVSTNQGLDSGHLADGLLLVVRALYTNTNATVTFAPDGHTARAIKTADGSGLVAGQIKAGAPLILIYRDAGTPVWHCANLQSLASNIGASAGSFTANKNEIDQGLPAGIATQVTFSVEGWDVGSTFVSHTWTPPSGTALIQVQIATGVAVVNTPILVSLYKNGSAIRTLSLVAPDLNDTGYAEAFGSIATVEQVNGSDYFSVYATRTTADDAYVLGKANKTWFTGTMV